MAESELREALASMVRAHGFEQVDQHLAEIRRAENENRENNPIQKAAPSKQTLPMANTKKQRPTALQYVGKMELPPEKRTVVFDLAGRFEAKSFLPTLGDIDDFCQSYGIGGFTSRSRANAIPRIFRFLVSMDTEDIRRILNEGMFSGPSRLGPIADAIRRNGRARTATGSNGNR